MDRFDFRSDAYAPAEAFAAYHDLYSGGADVGRADTPFFAKVAAYRFPRMLVFERHLLGVSHQRGVRRVARDGFDHVTVQLVLAGQLMITAGDTPQVVNAGDIVIFETGKPNGTSVREARLATIAIAREIIEKTVPPFLDLHGMILRVDQNAILRDFIQSLTRRAATLSDEVAAAATLGLGAFLCATLGSTAATKNTVVLLEAQKLDRVLAYIDVNCGSSGLTVDKLVNVMAISRSALYRMFEPMGGISAFLLQKRLQKLKHALSRPGEKRSVSALIEACGFTSISHATRAFHQVFGAPPGVFRLDLQNERRPSMGVNPLKDRLSRWHSELL